MASFSATPVRLPLASPGATQQAQNTPGTTTAAAGDTDSLIVPPRIGDLLSVGGRTEVWVGGSNLPHLQLRMPTTVCQRRPGPATSAGPCPGFRSGSLWIWRAHASGARPSDCTGAIE